MEDIVLNLEEWRDAASHDQAHKEPVKFAYAGEPFEAWLSSDMNAWMIFGTAFGSCTARSVPIFGDLRIMTTSNGETKIYQTKTWEWDNRVFVEKRRVMITRGDREIVSKKVVIMHLSLDTARKIF